MNFLQSNKHEGLGPISVDIYKVTALERCTLIGFRMRYMIMFRAIN
jgi:hypothetical protein